MAISFLHPQVAAAVVLGLLCGAILSWASRPATIITIVFVPVAALTWLAYSVTWSYPLFGFIEPLPDGMYAARAQWVLLGGLYLLVALPYVTARIEGHGIAASIAALIVTAAFGGVSGYMFFKSGATRIDRIPIQRNALYLSARYNGQGLVPDGVHVAYRGELTLKACRVSSLFTVDDEFTFSRRVLDGIDYLQQGMRDSRARDFLSKYLEGNSCESAVSDAPGGGLSLRRSCTGEFPRQRFVPGRWRDFFATDQRTGLTIPPFRIQSTLFFPNQESELRLIAPAGCVVGTNPAFRRMTTAAGTDTFAIDLGFPREAFALADTVHVLEDPSLLGLDLLRPTLQSAAIQRVVHFLLWWPTQVVLFISSVAAVLATLRLVRPRRRARARVDSMAEPGTAPAPLAASVRWPRRLGAVVFDAAALGILIWTRDRWAPVALLMAFESGPALLAVGGLVAAVELWLLVARLTTRNPSG